MSVAIEFFGELFRAEFTVEAASILMDLLEVLFYIRLLREGACTAREGTLEWPIFGV